MINFMFYEAGMGLFRNRGSRHQGKGILYLPDQV